LAGIRVVFCFEGSADPALRGRQVVVPQRRDQCDEPNLGTTGFRLGVRGSFACAKIF